MFKALKSAFFKDKDASSLSVTEATEKIQGKEETETTDIVVEQTIKDSKLASEDGVLWIWGSNVRYHTLLFPIKFSRTTNWGKLYRNHSSQLQLH